MRTDSLPVLRGHWKALADRRVDPPVASWRARLASVACGLLPAVVTLTLGWGHVDKFDSAIPSAVIAGASLLVGGLLTAFGVLTGWRSTLKERATRYPTTESDLRGLVDESVAHIMLAVLWSAIMIPFAAVLLVARNLFATFLMSALVGLASHTVFLFLLIVPSLYSAYTQMMDTEEALDGFSVRG